MKLHHIAVTKTRLRAVRAGARAAFGENTWVPPEEMAIDDSEITTVIDVAPYWGNKVRALSAHASQPPRRRAQRRLLVSRTLTKQCGATEFFGGRRRASCVFLEARQDLKNLAS